MVPPFLGFAVFLAKIRHYVYGAVDTSLSGPLALAEVGLAMSPPDV